MADETKVKKAPKEAVSEIASKAKDGAKNLFQKKCGKAMHLKFITKSDSAKTVNNKTGIEDLDIPINIIDE